MVEKLLTSLLIGLGWTAGALVEAVPWVLFTFIAGVWIKAVI